ncbi:ABC transporter substrate-binding protein [Pseudoalteromonas mariniglutinosa]|uniref:ABC transporter substrate-binding protein n=1 Tax=Pseudoalteromonas mariniglutinosa TaxID=206042 RepID=UPI00385077FF
MSTALSGPAQQIGEQLAQGSQLYFNRVNNDGGVNGSPIDLIIKDDGYEPSNTVVNTRQFIFNDQVNAIFGSMGTPTASAIKSLLEKHKIPFIMPYTGADFLHNQSMPNVFNLRASYQDEAKQQIKYLVQERKHANIGFLIQADEFGYIVESSLIASLKEYAIKPVKVARFKRNSEDITKALLELQQSGVTAVCLVGTYPPLAEFINKAQQLGFNPDYTSVSFASSHDLYQHIQKPTNIMVTEVVPNPNTCSNFWCRQFILDMADVDPSTPNRVQFEGYLNAVAFTKAIQGCPMPVNNTCIIEQLNQVLSLDNHLQSLFVDKQDPSLRQVYRSYFPQ